MQPHLLLLPRGEGGAQRRMRGPRGTLGHMKNLNLARAMRREPTRAERRLWSWLRDRRFDGWKFRRQYPYIGYILDFYCEELCVCIEVDGRVHDYTFEYDEARTTKLIAHGIRVIRIKNEDLMRQPQEVADWLREQLRPSSGPSGHLLPRGEGA